MTCLRWHLSVTVHFFQNKFNEEHDGLVKYGCNACQFKALKYAALKKHAKREHNGTKDLIINFGREIRKTKELSCRVCSQIIKDHRLLRAHFKIEHPEEKVFKCSFSGCGYGSEWLPNINTHMSAKHEKREQKCDRCDYKSVWRQSFLEQKKSGAWYFYGELKTQSPNFISISALRACVSCVRRLWKIPIAIWAACVRNTRH